MVRALRSHRRGRGFEPLCLHHRQGPGPNMLRVFYLSGRRSRKIRRLFPSLFTKQIKTVPFGFFFCIYSLVYNLHYPSFVQIFTVGRNMRKNHQAAIRFLLGLFTYIKILPGIPRVELCFLYHGHNHPRICGAILRPIVRTSLSECFTFPFCIRISNIRHLHSTQYRKVGICRCCYAFQIPRSRH